MNKKDLIKESWMECYEQGVKKEVKRIKKRVSKTSIEKRKEKNHYPITIEEGDSFTQKNCGTNAISLAMRAGKRICLKGDDHYCYLFQNWRCIAAPLQINNKVIVYIDLSILNRDIREKDKMLFSLLLEKITKEILKFKLYIDIKEKKFKEIEQKVLYLSAKGYKINQISKKLYMSESAVKYYRRKICDKLGAENMINAVVKAIKSQYLDIDEIIQLTKV